MRHLFSSNTNRRLAALLALFVVLGITDAILTPLFENPDESSHLQVIRYFVEERKLYAPVTPALRVTTGPDMAESLRPHTPPRYYTPPFYHAVAALLTSGIDMNDLESHLIPNPAWDAGWAPQRNADPWNKNTYVHLPSETWRDSPTYRVTLLLRLVSVGLGALTVLCTYQIAHLIWPEHNTLALGAAAVVGLNPQFIALNAGVTNDPLLIAIFSLTLLFALRWMRSGAPAMRWAILGVLAGIGLMTKQSALLLLPLVGLAIIGQTPHNRHEKTEPRQQMKETQARKILADGFAFGVAAILVGGWWYAYNTFAFGDLLGMRVHFESQVALHTFRLREAVAIFETFWAGFGWALLSAPDWVYWILAGCGTLALTGIVRSLLAGGEFHNLGSTQRRSLLILAVTVILNTVSLVRWAIATGAPYGRLLFPSIAAIGVLFAWGLAQWRDVPGARVIRTILATVILLFTVLAPWTIVRPAFKSPVVTRSLPKRIQPLNVTFEDLTLLGYEAPSRDLHPGDTLCVTLDWHATHAPGERYTTFVQFSPQDPTRRIAEDVRWVGGTLYPSDFWRDSDIIRQEHALYIPSDAPAPGLYWIRLGLVDAAGKRVVLPNGEDAVSLGPWRVRERTPVSHPGIRVAYTLGDAITLRGYDIALDETLTVTLTWVAKATPPQDVNVFVHALDATGEIVAQHDGPPAEGRYPTTWWLPGDVIADVHTLVLPGDVVQLHIGMYDPATFTRLPVTDTDGTHLPDDAILLPLRSTP